MVLIRLSFAFSMEKVYGWVRFVVEVTLTIDLTDWSSIRCWPSSRGEKATMLGLFLALYVGSSVDTGALLLVRIPAELSNNLDFTFVGVR